jgi:hypothetical protein
MTTSERRRGAVFAFALLAASAAGEAKAIGDDHFGVVVSDDDVRDVELQPGL